MLHKSANKLLGKTHSILKWQLTALSGALTTGLIVFLES
jgi:hypothetical protein